jgi:hypothetical protein
MTRALADTQRPGGIDAFFRITTQARRRRRPRTASNSARPVETVRPSDRATCPPAASTAAARLCSKAFDQRLDLSRDGRVDAWRVTELVDGPKSRRSGDELEQLIALPTDCQKVTRVISWLTVNKTWRRRSVYSAGCARTRLPRSMEVHRRSRLLVIGGVAALTSLIISGPGLFGFIRCRAL